MIKIVTDPTDRRYLLDQCVSVTLWSIIHQFHVYGYMDNSLPWKKETALYTFVTVFELFRSSYLVNIIYYQALNATLVQLATRNMRDDLITYLPLYWIRGKQEGFKIGDEVKGLCFILREHRSRTEIVWIVSLEHQ